MIAKNVNDDNKTNTLYHISLQSRFELSTERQKVNKTFHMITIDANDGLQTTVPGYALSEGVPPPNPSNGALGLARGAKSQQHPGAWIQWNNC